MNQDAIPEPDEFPSCDIPLLWYSLFALALSWVSEVVLAQQFGGRLAAQGAIGAFPLLVLLGWSWVSSRKGVSLAVWGNAAVLRFPLTVDLIQRTFLPGVLRHPIGVCELAGSSLPGSIAVGLRQRLTLSEGWLAFAEDELRQERGGGVEAVLLHERSHLRHHEPILLSVFFLAALALVPGLVLLGWLGPAKLPPHFVLSCEMVLGALVISGWIWLRREAHADLAPTRFGHTQSALVEHLNRYKGALALMKKRQQTLHGFGETTMYLFRQTLLGVRWLVVQAVYPRDRTARQEPLLFPGYGMVLIVAFWICALTAWWHVWFPGVGAQMQDQLYANTMESFTMESFINSRPYRDLSASINGYFSTLVSVVVANFLLYSIWIPVLAAPGFHWKKGLSCCVLFIGLTALLGKMISATIGLKTIGQTDILMFVVLRLFLLNLDVRLTRSATQLSGAGRILRLQGTYATAGIVGLIWWTWIVSVGMLIAGAYFAYLGSGMEWLKDVASFTLASQLTWALSIALGLLLLGAWLQAQVASQLPCSGVPLLALGFIPVLLSPLAWQEPGAVMLLSLVLFELGRRFSRLLQQASLLTNRHHVRAGAFLRSGGLLLLALVVCLGGVAFITSRAHAWPWEVPQPWFVLYVSSLFALSVFALVGFLLWLLTHLMLRVRLSTAPRTEVVVP